MILQNMQSSIKTIPAELNSQASVSLHCCNSNKNNAKGFWNTKYCSKDCIIYKLFSLE